jgi:hypothetical protein
MALAAVSLLLTPAATVVAQDDVVLGSELAREHLNIRTRVDPGLPSISEEARGVFGASIFIEATSNLGDLRNLELLRWREGAMPTPEVAAPGTTAGAAPVETVNIGEWARA